MPNNASDIARNFELLVARHGELNVQLVNLRSREAKTSLDMRERKRQLRNREVSVLIQFFPDAKNAEGRKLQQEEALVKDELYQNLLTAIDILDREQADNEAGIDACQRELKVTELQMQMDIAKLTNLNTPRFHREI